MTTTEHTWIGKDIKRREDPALLMGTAIYTNDMKAYRMRNGVANFLDMPRALRER